MKVLEPLRQRLAELGKFNTIIQFGLPRSGSTLVYNVLRELFPRKNLIKKHLFKERVACPVVVTYRHPLDAIASSIQRYGLEPTEAAIAERVREFDENGLWDIAPIRHHPRVLLLRYEDFVFDFDFLLDRVSGFFGLELAPARRETLARELSLDAVQARVAAMASFADVDPLTHWHGNHISRFRGRPGYHTEFFDAEQVRRLSARYAGWLAEFGYAEPDAGASRESGDAAPAR